MAVRTSCPRCGKRFSAPEDYIGRKVDCPRCSHRLTLLSPEEERVHREREEASQRRAEEDRRRLELIERLEKKDERAAPYYERFRTGLAPVRHYNPSATSRFLRLRGLSDLLILMAYVVLMLVLVGAGLTVYLKVDGVLGSVTILLLCLVGWALLGATLFFTLKCLGELAVLLADIGDEQRDLVRLLLDIRESTDRSGWEPQERESGQG